MRRKIVGVTGGWVGKPSTGGPAAKPFGPDTGKGGRYLHGEFNPATLPPPG